MSPQTERNLEKAMAVEAFASAKYTRFAACARMNDNPDLAKLFQIAADTAHFRKEFNLAHVPCDDAGNLQSAINDKDSMITMYSKFAMEAEAAGDDSAAAVFENIRQEEMSQVRELGEALGKIRSESGCEQTVGAVKSAV
ncbi:MAG TPA: hypothetical protein VMF91_21765 [Bryobacteraceae bacterium]|nr:hypothetical protein [Bryobacteraceae bacterium]